MKVRLVRDARIKHSAGEIVEVSPTEFIYLTSVKSAVPVVDDEPQEMETPEQAKPKRTTRKKV